MLKTRNLPDAERLSVLAATILLAYALARFVNLPGYELAIQLPGVYLSVEINVRTFVTLLVAGLTASGADWLLRDHPALGDRSTLEHWLLPALTAWVIGIPLFQTPPGPIWWAGFALGGGLLMLVLVAEYIAVDPEDIRQPPRAKPATRGSRSYRGIIRSLPGFMFLPAIRRLAIVPDRACTYFDSLPGQSQSAAPSSPWSMGLHGGCNYRLDRWAVRGCFSLLAAFAGVLWDAFIRAGVWFNQPDRWA